MSFRKLTTLAFAAAIAAAPAAFAPAVSATASEVRPGMTVVDPSGGTVGLVTAVQGENLVLKTDAHEVQVPLSSFTAHEGKLLFGMTATQLNAETEKSLAEAQAALVVGAPVLASGGTPVGTIDALDAELITIKLTEGGLVRLPRSGAAGTPDGVVIGLTAAELRQSTAQPAAEQPAAEEAAAEQPAT